MVYMYFFAVAAARPKCNFLEIYAYIKKASDGLAAVPWEPHCTVCLNFNSVEGIGYQLYHEDLYPHQKLTVKVSYAFG